tara:strand:+ start:835 stop:1443 length:609 start_codon:yes stop_codon:yes gene_type:complete
MALSLKTPPASLATLMLQDVCDHLRRVAMLDAEPAIAPPDLAHIERLIASAVSALDGPDSKTRRALLTQTWTATFDYFAPELPLLLPPVQSITSVKYVDTDGALQTADDGTYTLHGAASWDPIIAPTYGESWPATRAEAGAVTVEFIAGYGDTVADIPAPLLQAIRQMVAEFYETREGLGWSSPSELPHGVRSLVQPYRIYR